MRRCWRPKLGALVARRWRRRRRDRRLARAVPGRRRRSPTPDRQPAWVLLDDDPARPARWPARPGAAEPASTSCTSWSTTPAPAASWPAGRPRSSRRPRLAGRRAASLGADRAGARPAGPPRPPRPAPALRPILADAGLEVVVEHGTLIGEVHGLEVARVVVDDDGERARRGRRRPLRPRGGRDDARRPGRRPTALARVVDSCAVTGAPAPSRHPLNQLVPERWLRSRLVADPCSSARPSSCRSRRPCPRRNLRETLASRRRSASTPTAGRSSSPARPASTSTSCPSAADDRLPHAPGARLVLVRARAATPTRSPTALAGRSWTRPRSSRSTATGWTARRRPHRRPRDARAPARRSEQEFDDVEARLADPDVFADQDKLRASWPGATRSSTPSSAARASSRQRTRGPGDRHARCSPTLSGDDREMLRAEIDEAEADDRAPRRRAEGPAAAARTPTTAATSSSRSAAPRAARRPTSSPGTCSRCTRAYAAAPGVEARGARRRPVRHGRLQRGHLPAEGRRRLDPHEARGRPAPRAAGAGHRVAGPHPHVVGHGDRAARGRGGRRRHRPERPADRRLPLVGPGRAVGQHHRLGGAHHPQADRPRRVDAGREEPDPEPGQGHAGAAVPAAEAASRTARAPSCPRPAGARSAAAGGPRRSAPTTSRRTGSPTTASGSPSTSSTRCWPASSTT